jgi:sec-independent protein translocase protein TatA
MGLENPIHLLVLAVIILLVFGSSQLPKIARSAGKHARDAKDGIATFKQEFEHGAADNPLIEVADTLRSANPRTIVRDAVSKATTPSAKPAASPKPAASSKPKPRPKG